MSSNEDPREQAVPPFHEVLKNALARQGREPREPQPGEPGIPPPPPEQAAEVQRTPLCAFFDWLVDWYVGWRCSQKQNRMVPCTDEGANDCPCVAPEGHGHCTETRIPDLRPCVNVYWGDSRCDCLESDDTEVLCITVCNCYSNVTFSNLTIGYVLVTDANGNGVDTLPDGSPAVDIRPLGPICFGDLPPCRDGQPSCVSREVVLIARGARAGGYQVRVGAICFSATFGYDAERCFRFDICKD